jgi:ATP phosphoribosyltransferase
MSLTIALAKGKLLAGTEALFGRAGLPFPNGDGRKLVIEAGDLRFLLVKDVDVPTYVEHGVADCGIVGRDVLLEAIPDVYEPLDLRFGHCRLSVARPVGADLNPRRATTLRVGTKYPRVSTGYFLGHGISADIVPLSGSVEIAPVLGLADCIVDVVETGRTLRENGLEVVEDVATSTARLIVNRASFHTRRESVGKLLAALEGALERPR